MTDDSKTGPDALAEQLEMQGIPQGSYSVKPLDGVRKLIARRLTESARDIPHFPLTVHLAIDPLLEARHRINAEAPADAKVSVNDLIVKAAALALKAVPGANASFTDKGIILHNAADVAVAVAIEGGLVTPIVRAAETKTVHEIAAATKDLADRAKRKRLKPDEYVGGTFCVSNLGMFGISSFGSILNPPQGAILSVGAGEDRVVPRDGAIVIAKMMTVTLTCDHRVIDGATGARWLQSFKGLIEDPSQLG